MSDPIGARSDFYGALDGVDFADLAAPFGIPAADLRDVLGNVTEMLEHAVLVLRPAGKEDITRAARLLADLQGLLQEPAVDARLVIGLYNDANTGEQGDIADDDPYIQARDRLGSAYENLRDLEEIIAIASRPLPPGRPSYDMWFEAALELRRFWTDVLGRDDAISGHANDPRGVTATEFVKFVSACLTPFNPRLNEQACRTVLQNLREMDWDLDRHRPYGIT